MSEMALATQHWLLDHAQQPLSKRRRIGCHEVNNELCAAGLSQPALSLICSLDRSYISEADANPAPKRLWKENDEPVWNERSLKRTAMEQHQYTAQKRHRGGAQPLPVSMSNSTSTVSCREIVPYNQPLSISHNGVDIVWQQPLTSKLPKIAVDPSGIAFMISDSGVLLADIPPSFRLTITNGVAQAEAAKIAIDANGTAYLLSEAGELLISMSAVKSVHGGLEVQVDKMKMLGDEGKLARTGSTVKIEEIETEVFSPVTTAPPNSAEYATEQDSYDDNTDMDLEVS